MREILAALDAALMQDDHVRARMLLAEISDLLDAKGRQAPIGASRGDWHPRKKSSGAKACDQPFCRDPSASVTGGGA